MSADTAPAEMPGEEDVARVLAEWLDIQGYHLTEDTMVAERYSGGHWHALNLKKVTGPLRDLFAPILAEKEREIERACADHANATIGWERERGLREAAEAALAAERERIATNLDAQAGALWERCETKRSNPPSVDEQADAAQAFALQKAAAAIRAQGE